MKLETVKAIIKAPDYTAKESMIDLDIYETIAETKKHCGLSIHVVSRLVKEAGYEPKYIRTPQGMRLRLVKCSQES